MQALAERLDALLAGTTLRRADLLGFSSLKTYDPSPGLAARAPAPLGRPPGQVPRVGVRRRRPRRAAPLPGRPPRHRGAAQEDEAAWVRGALRVRPRRRRARYRGHRDPRPRARHPAQGVVVGAGAGRRGTAGRPGARAGERGVRRLHPHQRLQPPPHDGPAGPARRVGHRSRLGRRHLAPGQAVALRLAALAEPRPARGPAHRRVRGPRRRARARAHTPGRALRGQARRPLRGAQPLRPALPDPDCADTLARASRSSPTRWRTARRARRAARCWPIAASPAC